MKLIQTIAFVLISISAFTQDNIKFSNALPIEENRYPEIKGSPYYYEDWVAANIQLKDGSVVEKILMNFNAYENALELKKDDKYIEFDVRKIAKMVVQNAPQSKNQKGWMDTQSFVYSPHEKLSNQLVQLLYEGSTYRLFKKIDCTIAKHEKNVPGETVTIQRFNLKETYYLEQDGKLNAFFLNKKGLKNNFKTDEDIFKWAKSSKINLYTDSGIVSLLEHLD